MYENIYVLNVRVNKFSWVPHENILTRKFFQLYIIEITVLHAFPNVTSYLSIATYLFTCAAEICISPIRLHSYRLLRKYSRSSITRLLQR